MLPVKIYDLDKLKEEKINIVVCVCNYKGKWIYVKHKERDTWEIPGGHIEIGETWQEAAKRELYEEAGIKEVELIPVCTYSISTYGLLCFANVKKIDKLPNYEIEKIAFFDDEPDNLTYKETHKLFLKIIKERIELLDLYDNNYNILEETIVRGTKTIEGKNIMLSIIFIKNKDNKYLIQKTSKEKGSKYSLTGGHVQHNETGIITILRELKEELNIDSNEKEIFYIDKFKYPKKNYIFNVYKLESKNIDINKIKLQKEEVEKVIWLTKEEINNLIDNNEFLETHAYIFKNYNEK